MKKCSTLWKILTYATQRSRGIALAMTLLALAIANDGNAQLLDKKITLTLHEVPIDEALSKIESLAGVKFFYSLDQLQVDQNISFEAIDRPLREVLQSLLTPLKITYKVHEKEASITLKRQTKNAADESSRDVQRPDQAGAGPVTGKITDAVSGQPMAGVNVIVKGTTAGTTTDSEGRFILDANPEDILIFSFIGFQAVETQVGERTTIELSMEEDLAALKEVVVYASGYNEISPDRSTGSYTHLGKELLDRNVGTDVLSRLNGLAPALFIDQRSGKPFFNIRGRSTILANDQPLIVLDNFPYNGDLNTINPNDIESITILKDAAAASIWGVRAGNGVIVITTKKGSRNRPLQIAINSNVTTGDKPDLFYENKMSTSDFVDVEQMLFDKGFFDNTITDARQPAISPVVEILLSERNGQISQSEADSELDNLRGVDVRNDISKYFYQPSLNQQYAINLSGGTEKTGYYFSGGYDKNRDNRVSNGYERISLTNQYTFEPVDNLEMNAGIVYTRSIIESNNTLASLRMGSVSLYPYARFTDDAGNPVSIIHDYRRDFVSNVEGQGFLNWDFNPVEDLGYVDNETRLTNTRVTAGLKYTFLRGLSAEARYQNESQIIKGRSLNPVESYYTRNLINEFSTFNGTSVTMRNIPEGGILTFADNELKSQNGRAQLNFANNWKKHEVSALAGIEIRETTSESYSNRFYGYDPDLGSSIPVNYSTSYITYPANGYVTIPSFDGVGGTIDRYRSYFANAAYTFDQRYALSLSGRIDQSNLFGVTSNQKSAPLWSAGTKWNLHKETFYKVPILPILDLRATYGFNGNIDENVTAFTTARFLTAQWSRRNAARLTSPPNPQLRWEKIRMLNLGLDFGFIRNVVSGSVEYYRKQGEDLFGLSELDPTVGLRSFKGNVASIKGHGWDIVINTQNIDRKVKWNTSLFFNHAIDEVTKYNVKPSSLAAYFFDASIERGSTVDYAPTVGRPLFSIYSYKWAGLDPDTGNPRGYLNGKPSTDYLAMNTTATVDSLIYNGPALPPFFGALRNTFSFNGWSLSFNVTWRFGYFFRARSISYSGLYSNYAGHGDFGQRWMQSGDESKTNVPSMNYPVDPIADSFYLRSDVLVQKGDNIRLQDIQISYDFPQTRIHKLGIKGIQLYSYANNIGILWKANDKGIDPDFPDMPLPRSIAFGTRITF